MFELTTRRSEELLIPLCLWTRYVSCFNYQDVPQWDHRKLPRFSSRFELVSRLSRKPVSEHRFDGLTLLDDRLVERTRHSTSL